MKLSIIIPYYNADKWIGGMLDSLLKQDLPREEYEIIVVDDGSKNEPKVLKDYVCQYANINYFRQENAGPGAARNTGLSVAKGEYVFFCDSDDYVATNVLGGLLHIVEERGLDMLFFNVPRVNEGETVPNGSRHFERVVEYESGQVFFGQPVVDKITTGVWQFIIRREFIERASLRFPSNRIMNEDSSFFIDAVLAAGKTAKVDVDVYFYVQNPQSLIHQGSVLQAKKWSRNMFLFVQKMTTLINENVLENHLYPGCLENLKWCRNQKAFIMLLGSSRNLSTASFRKLITELKGINAFPKPFGRYKFLKYLFLQPFIMKTVNMLYSLRR